MGKQTNGAWALLGEAVVAPIGSSKNLPGLPRGFHRVPGPAFVVAENFTDSPVGPFLSLSFARPARLGLRNGFYFGLSVVNNANARRVGRLSWGYPHELGALQWINEGSQRGIIWDERGMEVRGEVFGRPLPIAIPIRTMQKRSDGPVVIPTRLRAIARRARVGLTTTEDDPLAANAGFHTGWALSGMLLRRQPARRPNGLFATLRIPAIAPEPGVIGMDFPLTKVNLPSGV